MSERTIARGRTWPNSPVCALLVGMTANQRSATPPAAAFGQPDGAHELSPVAETCRARTSPRPHAGSGTALPTGRAWRHYGAALAAFAAVSLLNLWLQQWIGYQTIALVYLLMVVFLALGVSRGPLLLGTALSAVGWRFLFAPPRYSFSIADTYDEMMFVTYFAVALTIGELTARLRAQRAVDRDREERASALYQLARELAAGTSQADVLHRVVRHVKSVFGAHVAVLLPTPNQPGQIDLWPGSTWEPAAPGLAVALQAFENNLAAGRGTSCQPQAEGLYLPLTTGKTPAGILGLRLPAGRDLTASQRDLLDCFAREIAVVLERQQLRDTEVANRLLTESERLGRTLLNSVSHELRTPIAAIVGAASSLRASNLPGAGQQDLTREIESAAARLNRVVQSLLGAARLQSGQIRPRPDWCDVADLVRVTLRGLKDMTFGHPITAELAPDLPLLRADFVLLEQALSNLILNAVVHTPPGTAIQVAAHADRNTLVLEVADRGPGLPVEHAERIFEPFHRGALAPTGGAGLGLAIARGFVEAQGGKVEAANRLDGGAVFCIRMPLGKPPELPAEMAKTPTAGA